MKHASYILSSYSNYKYLSLDQLLQIGSNHTQDPNPIPSFDENLLLNLCLEAKNVFMKEKNVLEIDGDVIVVGDIHGSYHDLLRILNYVDSCPSKVIFLGDYVDRGCFSLECITLLFSLKIKYPNRYFLLRGNHEFDSLCSTYGFKKEILNYHNPKKKYNIYSDRHSAVKKKTILQPVNNQPIDNDIDFDFDLDYENVKSDDEPVSYETLCDNYFANHVNMNCYKYTETLYNSFIKVFSYLPIAALVNKTSLCIHGGLSPLLDKIDKINKNIQRPITDYDQNPLLCDNLWGDPSSEINAFFNSSPRGRGKLFSGAYVVNFLKNNGLNRLIRAHECVLDGVTEMFNEKCITVFSASSYDQDMGNMSGILKIFQKKDKIEFVSFKPLHRLEKVDALYYKVGSMKEEKPSKPVFSQYNLKSISSFGVLPEPMLKVNEEIENSMTNVDPDAPIQTSRSVNVNNLYLKPGFVGPTISFNTGAASKRSQRPFGSPLGSQQKHFDNHRYRALRDNRHGLGGTTNSINMSNTQVTLPTLIPKATI